MTSGYIDLVLDNGTLVRVEYPAKHEDEVLESIDNARARGDTWSPSSWDGCSASYQGLGLGRVNMNRVIGTL